MTAGPDWLPCPWCRRFARRDVSARRIRVGLRNVRYACPDCGSRFGVDRECMAAALARQAVTLAVAPAGQAGTGG